MKKFSSLSDKIRNLALISILIVGILIIFIGGNNKPLAKEITSAGHIDLSQEEYEELVKLGIIAENQDSLTMQKYQEKFAKAYRQNIIPKKQLFEEYIPLIGVNGILDFLEEEFPLCHEQSHDLGKAVFSLAGEIGPSIRVCGTGCTSGCMHGILMEAFHEINDQSIHPHEHAEGKFDIHVDAETLKNQINSICESSEFTKVHKIGNCAHGVGHAFMFLSNYDINTALEYCSFFEDKPLQYYCSTGGFMEYTITKRDELKDKPLHYPCDTNIEFPAACYRYKTKLIAKSLNASGIPPTVPVLAKECFKLDNKSARLGCFHGLGFAYTRNLHENPSYLLAICSFGGIDEQQICIEGAIEKLADFNETAAFKACEYLKGKNKAVCIQAAKDKMYRLDKSFRLYFKE